MSCEYGQGPELLEANEEAYLLWLSLQTQWRTGGFGIIGLDYNVLYREVERLEIDLSVCTMKKIQALENEVLTQQGKRKK